MAVTELYDTCSGAGVVQDALKLRRDYGFTVKGVLEVRDLHQGIVDSKVRFHLCLLLTTTDPSLLLPVCLRGSGGRGDCYTSTVQCFMAICFSCTVFRVANWVGQSMSPSRASLQSLCWNYLRVRLDKVRSWAS